MTLKRFTNISRHLKKAENISSHFKRSKTFQIRKPYRRSKLRQRRFPFLVLRRERVLGRATCQWRHRPCSPRSRRTGTCRPPCRTRSQYCSSENETWNINSRSFWKQIWSIIWMKTLWFEQISEMKMWEGVVKMF